MQQAAPAPDQYGYAPPAPIAPVAAMTPVATYGPPPTTQPLTAGATAPPAQTFGTPFGAPYEVAPSSTGLGRKQIGAIVVAAIVALGVLGFGWNVWKLHQNIGVPTTLGGFAQSTDATSQQALANSLVALKKENPGKKTMGAAYGSASSAFVMLIAARGHLTSMQSDFAAAGANGAQQQIGHNTCAAVVVGFLCERTSKHLTEGVFAVSRTMTITQASAMLDEAWAKA